MSRPLLRVITPTGYDRIDTDGTLDFDGGSLLVWRNSSRKHLIAAYSPQGWLTAGWETEEDTDVEQEL
ncbi:hypothetical protein [Corynebacterium sp.]|uniref:hypothetical protein n=1 Tax=Corynebacterium sp. TaxID=1720 RepID=UPI0028ADA971|nr:hypothetical protein [Corynebacterium sp.]